MNNKTITSEQFTKAWFEVVMEKRRILSSEWRNAAEFTNLIKGCEENVLRRVAEKVGLHCYCSDYYSIDSILYDDYGRVPGLGENTYFFREIRVAFEHENVFNTKLYQEVAHLLIVDCDLKVLVTYPNGDPVPQMNHLHDLIKGTSKQKEISDSASFLIILGYESEFEWEAYVYKEDDLKLTSTI